MFMSKETDIYKALSTYLSLKHKGLIWRFDFAAGTKMTFGQSNSHKSMNPHRGYPDFFLAEPIGKYSGLYIEIKKQGCSPFKKDGLLKSGEHLKEQQTMLQKLHTKGYMTLFCTGIDECIETIEQYLKNE
jgi:hypothetical protein